MALPLTPNAKWQEQDEASAISRSEADFAPSFAATVGASTTVPGTDPSEPAGTDSDVVFASDASVTTLEDLPQNRQRRQGPESRRDRPASPWEVTLIGAGSNDEKFRAGGVQLGGSVGYYFTEVVELVVRQNMSMNDAGPGASATWNGSTRVALDFHFPMDQVVPYVGVNAGFIYGDSVNETLAAGPEAGLKYYVKPDVFIGASIEYEFFFDSSDRINQAFDRGTFIYGLGFGVRF